jgi:glycerol kinase
MKYVMAIDQGTSSSRVIIFNEDGNQLGSHQLEHEQIYPVEAWVEHDPEQIWKNTELSMTQALRKAKLEWTNIKCIGITNQRETVVAWDKKTGNSYHNAIVWQCRRTAPRINELKNEGLADTFHKKTGLVLDAYFSGTKIEWLLNYFKDKKSNLDNLVFGTIDSWLTYKLTGNHVTDASNASRTLLFDINNGNWDQELAEILNTSIDQLPTVKSNFDEPFGYFTTSNTEIPVTGILGDQQSALFGQLAFEPGHVKNTYGTGNFTLLNTGEKVKLSNNGLLSTIAWQIKNKMTYSLEGSVFVSGAALRWLRDGLGIIQNYDEIDPLAKMVKSSGGVLFIPAFVGLGAPYWDSSARGTILGLTSGTKKSHIIRATLDAIAYQTQELIELMNNESGLPLKSLRVDGGITKSDYMMQIQADVSQIEVVLPRETETTAFGAALIAGLGYIWDDLDDLNQLNPPQKVWTPQINPQEAIEQISLWRKGIKRAKKWQD